MLRLIPENAPGVKMTVEELTQQSMENDLIDLDGDGTKDMTANQAIPYIADQAATAMTPGILGYWEGNQVGALAEGKSVAWVIPRLTPIWFSACTPRFTQTMVTMRMPLTGRPPKTCTTMKTEN